MISIILALQAAPLAEMKSYMQPVSVGEGVALFQQVCFDKFPDPKAAMEIIANPDLGLMKLPETPSQAMQPGDAWTSPKARVSYVDAAWMPMEMGSPQCSVTVVLAGEPAHSDVATAMTAKMQLPATKYGKNTPRAQTQWNMPGLDPDKWRIFLTTEQTPSGTEMRTVIMNLRGKKKKQ